MPHLRVELEVRHERALRDVLRRERLAARHVVHAVANAVSSLVRVKLPDPAGQVVGGKYKVGVMLARDHKNVRQQGRDLANKLWNASRLILLNTAEVKAEPRPLHVEDRRYTHELTDLWVESAVSAGMKRSESGRGALISTPRRND